MPATVQADLVSPKAFIAAGKTSAMEDQTAVPKLADIKKGDSEESPSTKRKELGTSNRHRFKVVSQLVIAMKRFQGAQVTSPFIQVVALVTNMHEMYFNLIRLALPCIEHIYLVMWQEKLMTLF